MTSLAFNRMSVDLELVWDSRCETAESPLWDSLTRTLYFADLHGKQILAHGVDSGSRRVWDMPEMLGSLGLCRSGRLVVALHRHVALFDPRTGALQRLTDDFPEPATNKLNDGKVGPDGCFWVGSTNPVPPRLPTGSLYRVTPEGHVEKKSEGYVTANGLAWPPGGETMYHSDSNQRFIDAWDFDAATGRIANRRRIATLSDEDGRPDGAACDAEGYYWSAGVTAACLNRFSPTGALVTRIDLSIPAPSMPCFADGTLFVTILRRGRGEELVRLNPTMGGLFRMPAPAAGADIGLFAD
jgi:sugar lactone lactonase YvrE